MDKLKPEAIRVNLDMSQADFAKALGLTVRTYHYRLQKRTDWRYKELVKLGELGKVSLSQLEL